MKTMVAMVSSAPAVVALRAELKRRYKNEVPSAHDMINTARRTLTKGGPIPHYTDCQLEFFARRFLEWETTKPRTTTDKAVWLTAALS